MAIMPKHAKVNTDLRVMKGIIKYTQIAEKIGVSENTICRWFNAKNLDDVKRTLLVNAIKEIREGK